MNAITFSATPRGTEQVLTIDLAALLAQLQTVPDTRKRRGVRYPLAVLLSIAVLAKLCGQSNLHALADWAHARREELATLFGLPRPSMPHPTTWARVLGHAACAHAIHAALQSLLLTPSSEVPARASVPIALDGKTLRGTIPRGATQGVHLLAAYQVRSGVVLRQRALATKANELTSAPHVLASIDLEGVLVTGDAMFAQRSLSTQIVEAGGDYVWTVKDNQPKLLDDIRLLFEPQIAALATPSLSANEYVTVRQVELGHGRLEERVLRTSSDLNEYTDWPSLQQAFMVERISTTGRRTTREVRYGITSAPEEVLNATALLAAVRGHWQIENGLHYRRDVTLKEDASLARMGQAPHVLATLNNFVCGLAACAGISNLAAAQRAFAAALDRRLFSLTLH